MWAKIKKWDPAKVAAVVAAIVFAIGVPAIIIINFLIPYMECGSGARGLVLSC